jgi:hypothetical protein
MIVSSACFEHPSVHPQEDLYMQFYGISFMHPYKQSGRWQDVLDHTRQSSIRNNKYQVSPIHTCFSWWWAYSRPKHVEIDKYKYIKKNCAPSWLYLQDYTEIHGQQNIKRILEVYYRDNSSGMFTAPYCARTSSKKPDLKKICPMDAET